MYRIRLHLLRLSTYRRNVPHNHRQDSVSGLCEKDPSRWTPNFGASPAFFFPKKGPFEFTRHGREGHQGQKPSLFNSTGKSGPHRLQWWWWLIKYLSWVQEFLWWVEFEYNDWYSNSTQERGHSTHETWVKLEYNLFSQTSLTLNIDKIPRSLCGPHLHAQIHAYLATNLNKWETV